MSQRTLRINVTNNLLQSYQSEARAQVLFFTILASVLIIGILWKKLKPNSWRLEEFSFNRSLSTNNPPRKSIIRCTACRNSWIHPENRLSGGINWLGEDSIRWKCPSCGHLVVWERPLQFPHSSYGPNEDIGVYIGYSPKSTKARRTLTWRVPPDFNQSHVRPPL